MVKNKRKTLAFKRTEDQGLGLGEVEDFQSLNSAMTSSEYARNWQNQKNKEKGTDKPTQENVGDEDAWSRYTAKDRAEEEMKREREKDARGYQIRHAMKGRSIVEGKPGPGEMALAHNKVILGGGSKLKSLTVPGMEKPSSPHPSGLNRAQRRHGGKATQHVPHNPHYPKKFFTITEQGKGHSKTLTVEFHVDEVYELPHYTTLPKPDNAYLRRIGGGPGDNSVVYVWKLSRVDRNKLIHALNGNIPEAKTWVLICHNCHGKGHKSKDCTNPKAAGPTFNPGAGCGGRDDKNKREHDTKEKSKAGSGGKGGGGGGGGKKQAVNTAAGALAAQVADFSARIQADEDNKREKAKEEREKERAKKDEPAPPLASFGLIHQFTVPVSEPSTKLSWVSFDLFFKFVLPFLAIFFYGDFLLWPVVCITAGWLVERSSHILLGCLVGGTLFWVENLFVGWTMYNLKAVYSMIRVNVTYEHQVFLTDTEAAAGTIDPKVDERPIDCSYGERKYKMDCGAAIITEMGYVTWPYWGLRVRFYTEKVATWQFSQSAFCLFGAVLTQLKTEKETQDALQRQLSKCSKIDWESQTMVENNILDNTVKVLIYLKKEIDQKGYLPSTYDVWHIPNQGFLEPHPLLKIRWVQVVLGILFVAGVWNLFSHVYEVVAPIIGFIFTSLFSAYSGFMYFAEAVGRAVNVTATAVQRTPDFVYGYRVTDVFFTGDINQPSRDKELGFEFFPGKNYDDRRPMSALSPFMVHGFCMPIADRGHNITTAAGLIHRGASITPIPLKDWLKDKQRVAKEILEAYVPVLTEADLMSWNQYMDFLPYTIAKKDDLRRYHAEREGDFHQYGDSGTKGRETGMFNKEEPSAEVKHVRSIHAMHENVLKSDVFGSLGRFIKGVEAQVYHLAPSVKHLGPRAVAEKLLALGPGSKTVGDYSSYEASFNRSVQESGQFTLYDHVAQGLGGKWQRIKSYARYLLGRKNRIKNKFFNAEIRGIKCSGDLDTALSNWWDNLVDWATAFQVKHGVHWSDSLNWFLCEGDDNITDDHGFEFNKTEFANMGMNIKVQQGLELSEAGFCQKYVNETTMNLVGDPITFLGKRQFLPTRYAHASFKTKLSLMRATAMSTLSALPNAPVISEWAWRVMQITSDVTVKAKHLLAVTPYGQITSVSFKEPLINFSDRLMVSRVFGFTLEQQEFFTKAINNWLGGNLSLPLDWFPSKWVSFYEAFNSNAASSAPEGFTVTKTVEALRAMLPEWEELQ